MIWLISWICSNNLPSDRTVEAVMEIAYMVGDPEEVDTASLNNPGLVRIKIACRNYKAIRGETQVFINGESHGIKWIVETPEEKLAHQPTASKFDRRKGKDGEEDEEEEYEDLSDSYGSGFDKQQKNETQPQSGLGGGEEGSNKKQKLSERSGQNVGQVVDAEMSVQIDVNSEQKEKEKHNQEFDDLPMTQQSTRSENKKVEDGEIDQEDELVDYEDDPLSQEKKAMDHLDREFEIKAMKLLNVLILPGMEDDSEELSGVQTGSEKQIEIDGQQIDVYGTNEKSEVITVKGKSKVALVLPQRKSLREGTRQGGSIQGKAEAAKEKKNDVSGNKTSFAIFNSVDHQNWQPDT